jgi:hypothetical protein
MAKRKSDSRRLNNMPLTLCLVSPPNAWRTRLGPTRQVNTLSRISERNDAHLSHRIFLRLHSMGQHPDISSCVKINERRRGRNAPVQLSAWRRRFFLGGSLSPPTSRSSPSDPAYDDGGYPPPGPWLGVGGWG